VIGARFVLATANPYKAAEIRSVLAVALPGMALSARPREIPEIAETGATLAENARIKAVELVTLTGEAAIADDTGLEVDALGGAPGVRTARYAGEHASYEENVAKLLRALSGTAPDERGARFVTVAIARFPDGSELVAEGVARGRIALSSRGTVGFGYDPVFEPDDGGGRTFAEMAPVEKDSISHRGRAFRALANQLAGRAQG
jgi:XTP/dITP diphosphohydrolase